MTRMSRRAFLRSSVAIGAGAMLLRYSDGSYQIVTEAAGPSVYDLRIIHTNDHHARIEPTTGITIQSTPKTITRNFGGVARRKTIFDQIRADATVADKLFLDAGDVFQGTLYFNQFNGAADLYFYNRLGYDAVAIGNHEFDKGDQILADFIGNTTFPMLAANVGATAPSPLAPLIVNTDTTPNAKLGSRTIITTGSGKKIGIFGLTTPEAKELSSPSANVTIDQNLVVVAQAQVTALKAANCDVIIGLTHIGYDLDLDLAKQTRGVNVIVGGHSHTPLLPDAQTALPLGVTRVAGYPTIVKDKDGKDVVVVTDWEWGKWVGDLVVSFDATGAVASIGSATLVRPVWADGIALKDPLDPAKGPRDLLPGEAADVGADSVFKTKIDTDYKPAITTLENTKVGVSAVLLDGERTSVRVKETNLGNLIADAMRSRIIASNSNPNNYPVVTITNGGGIRTSIPAGDVTVGKVLLVLPFGNTLAIVDVTGAQLKAALENGVSQVEGGAGRFPQVAGLRFSYDPKGQAASPPTSANGSTPAKPARSGNRVTKVEILEGNAYVPLSLTKKYRVVTNNFMLTGGDGYTAFTPTGDTADPSVGGASGQLDTGLVMADVVQDAIAAASPVSPTVSGRINVIYRTWFPELMQLRAAAAEAAMVGN